MIRYLKQAKSQPKTVARDAYASDISEGNALVALRPHHLLREDGGVRADYRSNAIFYELRN